jgi:hypothetical protein
VVTVGTEGMAKGSDIELSETWFSKDLGNELTCVATHMDGHLFAVGSTTHAYLCDLRTEQTVARFGAGDQWGTRQFPSMQLLVPFVHLYFCVLLYIIRCSINFIQQFSADNWKWRRSTRFY